MRKCLYALITAACVVILAVALVACSPAAPDGPKASSTADGPKVSSTAPYLSNTSFSPRTEQAINDFIAACGKDAPAYRQNAYVVSDFDDTTSISDITYQCGVYQLQTMSFALDPDGLRAAISTDVDLNADDNAAWVDDIDAAYRQLYKTYGPFSAPSCSKTPSGQSSRRSFRRSACMSRTRSTTTRAANGRSTFSPA